jgi:asparagine synthase (glutamine-hydrolysing)
MGALEATKHLTMCGLVGTLNLSRFHSIRQIDLRQMLGAIRHRGPDQFGIYVFQDDQSGIGLGSARLSIIDLSGGQQPMSNEDKTMWIVFNGEIFNYLELRLELERQGHYFATNSDTEVIVHLYEQYGPECVAHLNGQFVFAIWDEQARSLFIARDRIGIRPLYYTVQKGALIFASEIKAILTDERVSAEVDAITLDQIFTFWSPLSPRTPFKGINTLPPGHWLLAKNGDIRIEPYWRPVFPSAAGSGADQLPPRTFNEAACQLRELLIDATKIRLRADVPVAAYLSGGLDSSTITSLIHHYTGNRLETFSIAFTDAAYDESEFQRQVAAYLGTRHNLITCSHADIGRIFPEVIWHTETPIMRTSPAPLFLLSRLVRDSHFKVVLTGEGADEFLAGYNIFKEAKIRRFWARQPNSEKRPLLLGKLYGYVGDLPRDNLSYLKKFFGRRLTDVDAPDYSHAVRWHNNSRTKRVFSSALRAALSTQPATPLAALTLPPEFGAWHPQSRAQYLEITIFLAEYLLSSQGDRMSMAHSVEGRFPFLDHRVVEFCNQLPPDFKLHGLDEKHILKGAMRDLLPASIWNRAKQPYRAPIHRSFFPEGQPLDWVEELLSPGQVRQAGIFDVEAVLSLQKKLARASHLSETDDMTLAGVLSTQLVYRQFISSRQAVQVIGEDDDIKEVIHIGAIVASH